MYTHTDRIDTPSRALTKAILIYTSPGDFKNILDEIFIKNSCCNGLQR